MRVRSVLRGMAWRTCTADESAAVAVHVLDRVNAVHSVVGDAPAAPVEHRVRAEELAVVLI